MKRGVLPGLRAVSPRPAGDAGIASVSAALDHPGVYHFGTDARAGWWGPDTELALPWGLASRAQWIAYQNPWGHGTGNMQCVPQLFGADGWIRRLTMRATSLAAVKPIVSLSIYDNLGPSKLWPRSRLWQTTQTAGPGNTPALDVQTHDVDLRVEGGSLLWLGFMWAGGGGLYLSQADTGRYQSIYPTLVGGNRESYVLSAVDPGAANWSPSAWVIPAAYPGPATMTTSSAGVSTTTIGGHFFAGFTFEYA